MSDEDNKKPPLPDGLKPAWDKLADLLEDCDAPNDDIRDAAIEMVQAVGSTFDPGTFGVDLDTIIGAPILCSNCGSRGSEEKLLEWKGEAFFSCLDCREISIYRIVCKDDGGGEPIYRRINE